MAVLCLLIRPQSSSFTHSGSLNEERLADCCTLRRPKNAIPCHANGQSIYEIVQLSCVSNLTGILQSLRQLENTSNSLGQEKYVNNLHHDSSGQRSETTSDSQFN